MTMPVVEWEVRVDRDDQGRESGLAIRLAGTTHYLYAENADVIKRISREISTRFVASVDGGEARTPAEWVEELDPNGWLVDVVKRQSAMAVLRDLFGGDDD